MTSDVDTAPVSTIDTALACVGDQNIDSLIQQTVDECIETDKINNPVEILRHLQKVIVTGRALDITDVSQPLDGETNFIVVSRDEVLTTGFDELGD